MEERALLATMMVSTPSDAINGNTSSIAALLNDPGSDGISLREAITAANNTSGANRIKFDFSGTISPISPLPGISSELIIDGSGQQIELDGSNIANAIGLEFNGGGNGAVRGLAINHFINGFGIVVRGPVTNTAIENNFIGTDFAGSAALPANFIGIGLLLGASGTQIKNNVISANSFAGIAVGAQSLVATPEEQVIGTQITGNYIGTNANGDNLGNNSLNYPRGAGIAINSAKNTQIGDITPGLRNVIAFNHGQGVSIGSGGGGQVAAFNRIRGNSIHSNTNGLGIELSTNGPDGITANDYQDVDSGTNGFQNFPVLILATSGASTHVEWTLNSVPGLTYTLDFYANAAVESAGYEGRRYLGSVTKTADSNGDLHFIELLPAATTAGEYVTATATDPDGNTSEFSAEIIVNEPVASLVNATPAKDQISLRRATNTSNVEVVVNGVVQPPLPYAGLSSVTINGFGGNDDFLVDFANGDPIPTGGLFVNGAGGGDTLNLIGLGGVSQGKAVTVTETTIAGLGGSQAEINFSGLQSVNLDLTAGADEITVDMDNTVTSLTTFTVLGNGGDDRFLLNGVANLTTLHLLGGSGSDDFGSPSSPIHPLSGTNVFLYGDTNAIPSNPGGAMSDHLFLDMTTTNDGTASVPLVIVDTATGRASAANTGLLRFGGIEDIDLSDAGGLTDTEIGDLYVRAANSTDNLVFYRDVGGVLVKRNGLPAGGTTYVPTKRIIARGGGGNDYIELNFTLGSTLKADFRGEDNNDTLVGGVGSDTLEGGGGNDNLKGGEGNDVLYGEDRFLTSSSVPFDVQRATGLVQPLTLGGNDTLDGGAGNDVLFGGSGDDNLNGGLGDDYVHGGDCNDTLNSGGGNDILRGEAGADLINGDAGADIILGGGGDDRIFGRGGRDFMFGGSGADQIQDGEASSDVTAAGGLAQEADNLFTQPGSSLSGLNDNDLALQVLMFVGVYAWNGGAVFATRATNLASLGAAMSNDTVADIILGSAAGQDLIISHANDMRLNTTGDLLITL